MIVPSRSRKTAGLIRSARSSSFLKTGASIRRGRHRRRSKFSDDDGAGVIGNFRRLDRRRAATERESKERDRGVAGAGNIEDLLRFRRDVVRRLALF